MYKLQITKRIGLAMFAVLAAMVIACNTTAESTKAPAEDRFEILRAHIAGWLASKTADDLLIHSDELADSILYRWDSEKDRIQIVSVRKPEHFDSAGHIPNAMNIFWTDMMSDRNIARLDAGKDLVFYCYHGFSSTICSTVLSTMGYNSRSLTFGMMDWDLDALVKPPWDQVADYDIDTTMPVTIDTFAVPEIRSGHTEPRPLIVELTRKYFNTDGSPVIRSSAVKAIVDNWADSMAVYQVVDVRSVSDYRDGHVPHAINIPWKQVADLPQLHKLDPGKTVIVYSANGQLGEVAATVLNLLGYHAVDMAFGMMDWNRTAVAASDLWDGTADYKIVH